MGLGTWNLYNSGIAYDEIDIEEQDGAAELLMGLDGGKRRVPAFEVDGRAFNLSPYDERKLRAKFGLRSKRRTHCKGMNDGDG
ncbi:MAG TPA: hypothetical protein VF634_00005 [Pyrinomonadaceae bacterium]